jgi:hypothetical protein
MFELLSRAAAAERAIVLPCSPSDPGRDLSPWKLVGEDEFHVRGIPQFEDVKIFVRHILPGDIP